MKSKEHNLKQNENYLLKKELNNKKILNYAYLNVK